MFGTSAGALSGLDLIARFKYTFSAVRRHWLDVAALGAVSSRIIVAGGSTGQPYVGYRCAAAVADRLGATIVEFPSHHAGYITYRELSPPD